MTTARDQVVEAFRTWASRLLPAGWEFECKAMKGLGYEPHVLRIRIQSGSYRIMRMFDARDFPTRGLGQIIGHQLNRAKMDIAAALWGFE